MMFVVLLLTIPVSAMDYTAPEAPEEAQQLMPREVTSFGQDLLTVISSAMSVVQPALFEALSVCVGGFAAAMLVGMLKTMSGKAAQVSELAGVLAVVGLLLKQTGSMVTLAADTVTELTQYSKLLLPVMAAALASQGGVTSSTALYTGTAFLNAILSSAISKLLVPMIYVFLVLTAAAAATEQTMVNKLGDFVKWLITWCLKTVLYIFTGYMGITGVISGTADAATLKAAKLTMSGVVPVVGGILSDASEAVVISAGMMKNTVGIYGLLALIAVWIAPFIRIGTQYLLLKLTAALCGIFDAKGVNTVIGSFASAMGLLLAMTGTVCVLLLISVVCFMKGVS